MLTPFGDDDALLDAIVAGSSGAKLGVERRIQAAVLATQAMPQPSSEHRHR